MQTSIDVRRAYAGLIMPDQQFEFFSAADSFFPVRRLTAAEQVSPLEYTEWDHHSFSFESEGESCNLYDYISRNRIVGLLLMKDGKVCFENYQFGFRPENHWLSMSMAKSIASTLVGVAIQEGAISSLDDLLVNYLPELEGGAYADVSVRQLLLMSSGAEWNEDHTNPESHRRAVLELQIQQNPDAICRYMSGLKKLFPAGDHWNYSTGETHIVGALLRAATGQWLADYLQEKLWHPLGMEADASWWQENPGGLEIAGSGFNARLRDYARFARFFMAGGKIGEQQILPSNWLHEAAGPTQIGDTLVPYGFMWWSLADQNGNFDKRAFSARGIFGQRIYISPQDNCLAVMFCQRSRPLGDSPILDDDFFNAFCRQSK
ncbi:serine hydrolase domain-containing protein [Pseudoteredinibacter isoporae]|uniref:Beta-lactamase-related domain-containing protein n=1 Tax=Pseudoteredinibacter isoporae TaxID=570281 RepID=A0A7X0JU64_9GAMM|nr:serine hydrolase [Pseudoteredinibacter isoporae]MBB6522217.1 hypothetical protein [Pseudoteredinibacter isoporae]NHO87751.1 serine hydrolase [Pseudoteredinibacter isoporae]NIB23918.1 serine hydrolase [Pseudoteredinibacter isoporae]